mmetsp:Transcript_9068/g.10682  ORF Transcript_9068/g.10682 Transcript_9068/m.10682 type:complete len:80 (+) Transcript_9068:450-689(+)|eukprot:CAMPEP_0185614992 /NCGR_PEP_ID=MMETSP0436-20130131/34041_1 /TAXON_ID=626734 ORGANISM="Favella taraikaensis, Strain Fe Narragansett Bay" /NCGR_SAMPLE_ID=MMETSP0436 /ASSEMBLY_ACC=CAM_ASM_000390 /LENGTH=79 /DNA_ID=CAMNT_0028250317 /DNA_START=433 /DNA_END=672 /DNA_ORIENTATION=+
MAKNMRGKTVFAIGHGMFMHHLTVNLLQASNDAQLVEAYTFSPRNNGLTIIDFDVEEKEHFRGTGLVTSVQPRLIAHNL